MQIKRNYILITLLILMSVSCKNEKKSDSLNSNKEWELKINNVEINNIERPEKTIIRNLAIDTTKVFGIWTQDSNGAHADFWLTSKSFYVADYDGDGAMPYILDKNEITIFYIDFVQKGVITSAENNTLKIKWSDNDKETEYVKFED